MKDRRRHDSLRTLLYPWPGHWLLVGLIALIGGPWAAVIFYVVRDLPKAWAQIMRRLEWRARTWEIPTPRAVWVTQLSIDWRLKLLRKTGFLWLPKAVPVVGGDLFLFDLSSLRIGRPQVVAAARLPNPRDKRGRRLRRLVRVEAFWWLGNEYPLGELPNFLKRGDRGPIVALDPIDEEKVHWWDRLEAHHSTREPRRPTWRHERRARDLFHKLWGMHGAGEAYQKPVWNELQGELTRAGILM